MGSDRSAPHVRGLTPDQRRAVVRWSAVATVVVVAVVWLDVERRGNGNPVSLLNPGARGPSADVIEHDFPDLELPGGLGHDGQQFYAIARDPFPLDRSAPYLDRPQYRLQRPLYSWAAWALHPGGGGVGLVVAMFVVGIAALFVGGLALGHLVVRGGGAAWSAALFAALPGSFVALRISAADALALALALAALALLDSRRWWASAVLASLAVLAKEPTWLLLAAVWVARRDRRAALMVSAATFTAGAWAAVVRVSVDATGDQVIEFAAPFVGWWQSAQDWADGEDRLAGLNAAATVAVAVLALLWRRRSRWSTVVAVQLGFLTVLGKSVVGLNYNGSRTTMPLLAVSLVALLSRADQPVRTLTSSSAQTGSGIDGPGRGSGADSKRYTAIDRPITSSGQ